MRNGVLILSAHSDQITWKQMDSFDVAPDFMIILILNPVADLILDNKTISTMLINIIK